LPPPSARVTSSHRPSASAASACNRRWAKCSAPRSKSPASPPKSRRACAFRVAPPESYRAANVDYNPVLPSTRASFEKRADGRLFVRLVSDRGVQEPFVDVILEISWATGRLVREYTLLFDPPATIRAGATPLAARRRRR
jgi:hypothetical protein